MDKSQQIGNQGLGGLAYTGSLDETLIRKRLSANKIGRSIKLFDSIDSTNKKAKKMAAKGAIEGSIIIANEQVEGKGRLGRTWVSKKDTGIWMSIILRPEFAPIHAAKLTVISALAVSQALYGMIGQRMLIKWPNDLVMNGRKICGILTGLSADRGKIHYAIVGIGINVSSRRGDFPPELAESASSILLETDRIVDRNELVAEILNSFEELYLQFTRTGDFTGHRAAYRELSVTLGKRVRVLRPEQEFEGLAIDLTDTCTLLVRQDDGRTREVLAGDVSIRGTGGYI